MPNPGKNWRREELILALALYYRIPFSRANEWNPEIIRLAEIIGRTSKAVAAKIGNFASIDPQLIATGLPNAGKLTKEIWEEFNGNFPELAVQEFLIKNKKLGGKKILLPEEPAAEPAREGGEVERITRERVNQDFFRRTILAAYHDICCITGINIRKVLVASHIKPWAKCTPKEKLNLHNGLCLNALHDRAFDRGLITVIPVSDADYRIKVSGEIRRMGNDVVQKWLDKFDGQKIRPPEKFMPSSDFLDWHEKNIFRK